MGKGPWLNGCGDACIPAELASITTFLYNGIKIIVPIVLIIIGMYDMAKAITSKDEAAIKKAQTLLVRKAVMGALVFLLFSFIIWMLSVLNDTSENHSELNVTECLTNLFDYNSDNSSSKSTSGIENGYTDASSVCKSNGYQGALKVYSSGIDNYYYTCYKDINSSCENGHQYILGDGIVHCVSKRETSKGGLVDVFLDDSQFLSCNLNGSGDCQACCTEDNAFKKGFKIADKGNNQCLCIK